MPNVFLCFLTGKDAIFTESLEEESLIDVIEEILTKCFSSLNLPRPKSLNLLFLFIELYIPLNFFEISKKKLFQFQLDKCF